MALVVQSWGLFYVRGLSLSTLSLLPVCNSGLASVDIITPCAQQLPLSVFPKKLHKDNHFL